LTTQSFAAVHFSAVIRVHHEAGNAIETREQAGANLSSQFAASELI